MKKIALLTSGGDAPGMNAAIRAVVRAACFYNLKVFGIERGFAGLLEGQCRELTTRSVSDIVQRGGTILKTARCEEFPTPAGQKKAAVALHALGIDGLIVIGGDGSFRGAKLLSDTLGIVVAGIPATIDNDLPYTDFSIGFDTAVNTALSAINNIRDTMQSHDRVCVVEVMGRNAGDIALYSGIAGGAEIIVTPNRKMTGAEITEELQDNICRGKASNIIILAEGAGSAEKLSAEIAKIAGLNARHTVLGHIQRGGAPTMADRLLASRLGVRAVELLIAGKCNRLTGTRCGEIIDDDIESALSTKHESKEELYKIAQILSR